MRGWRRPRLAALLLGAFATAGTAQEPAAFAWNEAKVEELAQALIRVARIPSISIAVLQGDSIVYRTAFGLADVEAANPATRDTRYPMASVSKMFTITGLARLVEEGRLDLDQPASRYLPGFLGTEGFTTRQLAGHLAGIGHYQSADKMENRAYGSVTEALEVFRASPPVGPPGGQYQYSTHGYTLLSAIMEAAADTSFLAWMDLAVLTPLNLQATGPRFPGDPGPAGAATQYSLGGRQTARVQRPADKSYAWAGAGFVSTPGDMVRMGAAWWNGFIDSAVVSDFWSPQSTTRGMATGVGVGWRIGEDFAGHRIVHHSGSELGARTTLVLYPDEELAIATATNTSWNSAIEKNAQVMLAALRSPERGTSSLPSGSYRLSGTFSGDSTTTTLSVTGGIAALITPDPMKKWFGAGAVDSLPVFHLQADLWALVTPFGIAELKLGPNGGSTVWSTTRNWHFTVSPQGP